MAASWLLAERPGSDDSEVVWGVYAAVLAALASLVWNVVAALRSDLKIAQKLVLLLGGVVMSLAVGALGLVLTWRALVIACHGGYECPL